MSIYWNVTGAAVRRAMSLQDVNPASRTFGCCDRSFWQYRTIASFPAGTMQQLALPFAVLFDTQFAGNGWYQQQEMFDRARAAMLFWSRALHPAGTVDEWYRHEHSYCGTAFTTFGIAEAYLRLQGRLDDHDRAEIVSAVSRAAAWLGERFNEDVMNQNLAASAALWNVSQLTGDPRHKTAFERTWRRTLAQQHEEGWFVEYGGADLGYSLLALDLLASLHQRGCSEAAGAAERLSRFVAAFARGRGDLAGGLGSRGTEHSFAFGAEAFAPVSAGCRVIATHLRGVIERGEVADPRTIDDRYLAYFYLPSFVLASALGDGPLSSPPPNTDAAFTVSGFRVSRRPGGDVVLSMRRNAAFSVYPPAGPVHRNLGYWAEAADGRRFASCAWSVTTADGNSTETGVVAEGSFVKVDDHLPLVRSEVAFRAVTQWLFRWPSIAERFHRFIKQRKITRQLRGPIGFRRELTWHADGLQVTDTLRALAQGVTLRRIWPTADIDVHSPSARQSGAAPCAGVTAPAGAPEAWAARLNERGTLVLVTKYDVDDRGALRWVSIGEGSLERADRVEVL